MMRNIFLIAVFLILCLFIFFNLQSKAQKIEKDRPQKSTDNALDNRLIKRVLDLDQDGTREVIDIHSFETSPVIYKTEIFINSSVQPEVSLDGFYFASRLINLDLNKKKKIFEMQLLSGKLINSLTYKYEKGKLIRIRVSTEKPGSYLGIISSGGTEFTDIDNDGVAEMFIYHRHYPPEKKRTVEVYKYSGVIFEKQTEYEEKTAEVYL